MKVIKTILGVFLILGSLRNLLAIGAMPQFQLLGYLTATTLLFIIGAFLLYSALKPKPPNLSIGGDE